MKKSVLPLLALCAGLAFSFTAVLPVPEARAQQASGDVIREIRVVGTERIEPATVLTYLEARVGDRMTQDTLDRAVKSLFATGLFADVTVSQRGSALEVRVIENPVVNEIAFEGNSKIKDEDLLAEIQLRPRQVLTRTKVQSDANRLFEVYQRNGRFSATVEPKVIKLDQNRVNLVFEITEGPVTKVEGVRFVGNSAYDDDNLQSVISTKQERWYKFFSTDDRYDPDRLSYDQELLRRFYLSHGYADFRVVSAVAELDKDRDAFYLTFTVEEGERYRVGKVNITSSLRNFDANVLVSEISIRPNQWFNADELQETVDKLTAVLGDYQYAFISVKPDTDRDVQNRVVNINFRIDETPKVFVEQINIEGNMRTLDKVIRREVLLSEGDPFNRTKLAKSEQNIKDLGYFENVTVTPTQGTAPDKTNVDIRVEEKSTGELSVGAGFSTSDGPLADFRIRESNFLGKGQEMVFATTVAGERTEFDFSFTEPYFLDRDFSAGIDLFHVTRDFQDESSYDQRRTGGALRFGYPLSERWRQTLRYRYEQNEIYNVEDDASLFIREQEGERGTSAISQRITYDARDSKLFPTSGLYSWLDTEFAGLGGDASYVSGQLGSNYYYPIADRWILNFLGEVGAITGVSEDVEINERFFIGGNTLRGFERAGIGPRDEFSEDALGGNFFYRGTVEMSFPVGLPKELGVLGHGFTDFGSLWDLDNNSPSILDESSIRAAAGLGLSWRSPMGPIRADYSFPYLKEDFDKEEAFRFSFGTRF